MANNRAASLSFQGSGKDFSGNSGMWNVDFEANVGFSPI
jgi:hypothetical protein